MARVSRKSEEVKYLQAMTGSKIASGVGDGGRDDGGGLHREEEEY